MIYVYIAQGITKHRDGIMWNVALKQTSESATTMLCDNSDPQQSGIILIKLVYKYEQGVEFTVNVTDQKVSSIAAQLSSIIEEVSSNEALFGFTLTFSVVLKTNLYMFNQVVAKLRNEIQDFAPIEAGLSVLIAANKITVINTNRLHQQAAVAQIEDDVDNNQRASVFISALKSSQLLRVRCNFPNPEYESDIDSVGQVNTQDPEAVAMAAAAMAVIQEEYDYAEHDVNEYTEEENYWINSLIDQLNRDKERLIERGFLTIDGLSDLSKRLLANPTFSDRDEDIEKANFALNVIASLRALAPGGSHSHNGAMVQSKITGYGMRNVVALMWKCCMVTYEYDATKPADGHSFLPGVKYLVVLAALVRGIADGARGKNRNEDQIGDNLAEEDLRACDRGRFNALIEAFNTIVKEVEIIYEITDLLLNDLKREIILKLVKHNSVKDYEKAKLYLDIWHGRKSKAGNRGYMDFERQVKQAFPGMITQFLAKTCAHAPVYQAELRRELNREIKRVEDQSLGFSFIEQVSPTEELLREQWDLVYPPVKRAKQSAGGRLAFS